jgi:hypothetical protein
MSAGTNHPQENRTELSCQVLALGRWLKTWRCVPGWEQRGAFWLQQLNRTHNPKFLRAFCANSDGAIARLREARQREVCQ